MTSCHSDSLPREAGEGRGEGSLPRYRLAKPAPVVTITVNGAPLQALSGRSLLASLLVSERAGAAAADFSCAIGQCQRCLVRVEGVPQLACTTYLVGGENVETGIPVTE